jgi:hypothetical protein
VQRWNAALLSPRLPWASAGLPFPAHPLQAGSGIEQRVFVFPGGLHFPATMPQHDLRILRGEFRSRDALAVSGKQADDVRKLVQEGSDLGAQRAPRIEINVQQP